MNIDDLEKKHCVPCEGGVDPLDEDAAKQIAKAIDPQWSIAEDFKSISREFKFDGYNKTISFVNAVAWIAESEDHHPDLLLSMDLVLCFIQLMQSVGYQRMILFAQRK